MSDNINLFGIAGSPRKGSTEYIVQAALDHAKEKHGADTKFFSVRGKTLNFCIHCDYCVRNKKGCKFIDDMTEVYEGLRWADAVIIGTPVYQGALSAQTKVVLDRCRALAAESLDILQNRAGAALASGGDRIGGQELALQAILNFYIINEMIPVGGGSFGANLGGTFWSKDRLEEGVRDDAEGLRGMRRTVDRLMKTAIMLKKARDYQ